jgi:hypothetical protein
MDALRSARRPAPLLGGSADRPGSVSRRVPLAADVPPLDLSARPRAPACRRRARLRAVGHHGQGAEPAGLRAPRRAGARLRRVLPLVRRAAAGPGASRRDRRWPAASEPYGSTPCRRTSPSSTPGARWMRSSRSPRSFARVSVATGTSSSTRTRFNFAEVARLCDLAANGNARSMTGARRSRRRHRSSHRLNSDESASRQARPCSSIWSRAHG